MDETELIYSKITAKTTNKTGERKQTLLNY